MIIRSVLTALVLGLATLAVAAPPGILDGENIPADFTAADAGALKATQRNSTQFGDYFDVPGLWIPGSETDQLFVAKSADKLYIAISGNLEGIGHAWLIGINVPDRTGQQAENRSEGSSWCGDPYSFDPPWTLQRSARDVIIDDGGTPGDTPEDRADDTWSYGVDSGMVFPCDTDYVISIDTFSGTLGVHLYTLHDPAGPGAGTWDPTPDNLLDLPDATLYAEKLRAADSGTNDGDDILFEFNTSGFTEGGFDNTNEFGVTDTDGSSAATATTGLELAIPFATLQTDSGPLTGAETIGVYVLLADGRENGCAGDNWGHIVNQVLPPLAAGGVCDTPPGLIGFRPDLSTVMSCLDVPLSSTPTFGGGDDSANGIIDPADYGGAAIATQACPTPYGDQFFDLTQNGRGGGSELDALYVTSDAVNLYVGITGNLQENGDKMQIWIDNGIGAIGEHTLTWDGMGGPGDGMEGDAMPPLPDTTTDALFDYALSVNIEGPATDPDRKVWADLWDIIAQTSTFKGFSIRESGNGDMDASGGSNQWGMKIALNNLNTAGVPGCQPLEVGCLDNFGNPTIHNWSDDIATVEALAAGVTTGFEICIPLADIGINPCDGPATIHLWAHITGSNGWRSNQSLPSMRPEAGNADSTEQVQNAGSIVTDWFGPFFGLPEEFYRAVTATHVTTALVTPVNDCDSSGTEDVCDILNDPSIDLDFSGVPDVCEIVTCTVVADCADPLGDGVTDDVCVSWECLAGICVATDLSVPSDMGSPLGDCAPDTFCSLADALHALTCFAGTNTCDRLNIDAGQALGVCAPDGFCNLADALHALTCFAGTNTCACGPAPDGTSGPTVGGSAVLRAVADARSIKAGSEVQVRMFVDEPLDALLGYQLTAVVSGGRRGSLELMDIAVESRRDAVYTGAANAFSAFNIENRQMLAGDFDGPVSTRANGYLATFTFRASEDAVGAFVVDVVRDDLTQTLMVGAEQSEEIVVRSTAPAVVVVTSNGARSVR